MLYKEVEKCKNLFDKIINFNTRVLQEFNIVRDKISKNYYIDVKLDIQEEEKIARKYGIYTFSLYDKKNKLIIMPKEKSTKLLIYKIINPKKFNSYLKDYLFSLGHELIHYFQDCDNYLENFIFCEFEAYLYNYFCNNFEPLEKEEAEDLLKDIYRNLKRNLGKEKAYTKSTKIIIPLILVDLLSYSSCMKINNKNFYNKRGLLYKSLKDFYSRRRSLLEKSYYLLFSNGYKESLERALFKISENVLLDKPTKKEIIDNLIKELKNSFENFFSNYKKYEEISKLRFYEN